MFKKRPNFLNSYIRWTEHVHKLFVGRTACARAQFSGCSSTTNAHSETGQMAVCCQNLPLVALSSRSAPSVLVGALFKKFSLFLNTGVQSCTRPDDGLYQAETSGLKICTVGLCVTVYRIIYTEGKLFQSLLEYRIIKKSPSGLKICVSFSHQSGCYGRDSKSCSCHHFKKEIDSKVQNI